MLDLCGLALPDEVDGHRADERRRHQPRRRARRPDAPDAAHEPVLRVLGQPRDVPRRLEGRHQPRQPAHRGRTSDCDRPAATTSPTDRGRCSTRRTDPTEQHDLRGRAPRAAADAVDAWCDAAERERACSRSTTARSAASPTCTCRGRRGARRFRLRPGRQGPRGRRARTWPAGSAWSRRSPSRSARSTRPCCASRATGCSGGPGTRSTASCAGAIAGKDGLHEVAAPVPPTRRLLTADGTIGPTGADGALAADGSRARLGDPRRCTCPLAWAPDGAFLTVGYGRPFPVTDAYQPPATAPASLVDVRILVGPAPPLDLEAELARVMRHQ